MDSRSARGSGLPESQSINGTSGQLMTDSRLGAKAKRANSGKSAGQALLESDANVGVPLYIRLSRVLKDDIVNGSFPVGSLLPTEEELCKRFAVSRYTVREALRLLRDDGLVSSRQGAGTLVIPPRTSDSDIHQVMSINDLLAFASDARFEISSITMIELDEKLAQRTGLKKGEEWLQVCGLRQSSNRDAPVCWTEYYINRSFAAVGRLLQRHTGPIFPLIEDLFGLSVTEVHQQISATLISSVLADTLQEDEGVAALEVRRTYVTSDDKIAQVTINTHPASRFKHSMTMRRIRA